MPLTQPDEYEDLQSMLARNFAGGELGFMQPGMRMSAGASGPAQMDPSEKELHKVLQQKMMESMGKQQENIGVSQKALQEEQAKPKQVDISPLYSLAQTMGADPSTGKNYKAPEDNDEKIRSLRGDVNKQQGALTDDQVNYLKAQLKEKQTAGMMSAYQNARLGQQAETRDQRIHQFALNNIQKNPAILKRVTQFQNLDNQMNLVRNADYLTPQMIHDTQQLLLTNMGIGGQSTGAERHSRFIQNAGWDMADVMQRLSGNPADINKDSKLVKLIRELAGLEQKNIKDVVGKTLDAAVPGHGDLYKRRQDLRAERDAAVSGMAGLVDMPNEFAVAPVSRNGNMVAGGAKAPVPGTPRESKAAAPQKDPNTMTQAELDAYEAELRGGK